MGHHLIVGRKTFESIGKPLPGREMIVVTRDSGVRPAGCLVAGSVSDALATARERGEGEVFVIGGAEIYSQTLGLANRIYLTRVHTEVDADAFFPEFELGEWTSRQTAFHPADEKNQFAFTFELLERKT
jgi:dihydrofolate reductase